MKFCGKVGFWDGLAEEETAPGVYRPAIVEKSYFGEIERNYQKNQSGEFQNDNFTISNSVRILADLYLQNNWNSVRYVEWGGTKWKVNTIEVGYPSIKMELGGVYNEQSSPSGVTEDI